MLKSVVIAFGLASTALMASGASAQSINTRAVAQEASELGREAAELSQVARSAREQSVRELANDAYQLSVAASQLYSSAIGVCGRSAPDYLIAQQVESTCAAIERTVQEIDYLPPGCDFRLAEIANALREANAGLHAAAGVFE